MIILGNGDCLILAKKNKCYNKRRHARHQHHRHCQIQFLPIVHLEGLQEVSPSKPAANLREEQRLTCRSDIHGWAPCPEVRPLKETLPVLCDPLGTNTYRCETTHATVKTRCRIMETCDHAVLLSGGWNREHSPTSTIDNIKTVRTMLTKNGFSDNNVNIFYANGIQNSIGKKLIHN